MFCLFLSLLSSFIISSFISLLLSLFLVVSFFLVCFCSRLLVEITHSFVRSFVCFSFVRSFIHSFSLSLLVCLLPCFFSLFGWLVSFHCTITQSDLHQPSLFITTTPPLSPGRQPALVILYELCLQWPQLFNSQFILLQGGYCGQGVWLNFCV